MMIEDSNRFGCLSEQTLQQFELRLGTKLPDDYRRYLLAHNGGRPSGTTAIEALYGLHNGPSHLRVDKVLESARKEHLPAELLPIAHDGAGNMYAIGLRGPSYSQVYYRDHDLVHDPLQEPWAGISREYGGFTAFWDALQANAAVATGNVEEVRRWLEAGVKPTSLVALAAVRNHIEVLRLLLERGAQVNAEALRLAKRFASPQTLAWLESHCGRGGS